MTPKNKKLHKSHVQALIQKLLDGLLEAENLGNVKFKEFVNDRLVTGKMSFFESIKKNSIDTGIKESKRENTKMS